MRNSTTNDEIDLIELFKSLYRQKNLIIAITFTFTMISVLTSILIPKTYMAYAIFYVEKVATPAEIQETFNTYKKVQRLDYEVKITPRERTVSIEVYGNTKDEAKRNLLSVVDLINNYFFEIKETKERLSSRKKAIDGTLQEFFNNENMLINPRNIADLLYEKEEILRWLNDPKVIRPFTAIQVSSKPVRPKPLLYTIVGFTAGLFLGVFVALLREAIVKRKGGWEQP